MIEFEAEIEQFEEKGEKTGWQYIFISNDIALQIKPNNKKSFRIRGFIDALAISGLAAMPMGNGDFILALKASIRKDLKKGVGDIVRLRFEEHVDYKVEIPEELAVCLNDEPHLMANFEKLAPSHQLYHIRYVIDAKTSETRFKRIAMIVDAMDKNWDYGKMIRENRKNSRN